MSAAHTEGLLYVDKNADNRVTLRSKDTDYPIVTDLDDDEDARRLAACWNALDGLPTALLEKHGATRSGIYKGTAEISDQLAAAQVRITALETKLQEQDAMLGRRPCQNNRCTNMAAARALLTEFRDEADAWIKECGATEVTDPNQILERIRAFLKGGAA